MNIHRIMCGLIKNNNYIIERDGTGIVVDLSDFESVDKYINEKNIKICAILLTHSHWDHLFGVERFVKKYNVPVYLGSKKPNYIDKKEFEYTIEKYGVKVSFDVKVNLLNEGPHNINGFNFEVIEVPGHTYCSVIYYFKGEKSMFTGDFLFRKAVGIVNTKYSNKELMSESISLIKRYSDDIIIYPGHGPLTILGREKRENPYLIKGYRN